MTKRMTKKLRSKLEEVVPSIDMCKQIPDGAFTESLCAYV